MLVLLIHAAASNAHAAAPAAAEPTVQVSYEHPAAFIDAGDDGGPSEQTLAALTRHLQALGRRWLPAGQHLAIEVFQVDLAGRVEPAIRQSQRLRVIHDSDWPRIDLRYVWTKVDGSVERGEASLTDPTFLLHPIKGHDAGEPLRYEKRMLTRWFQRQFAAPSNSPSSR